VGGGGGEAAKCYLEYVVPKLLTPYNIVQ